MKVDYKKAHQGMKIILDKTMPLKSFNGEIKEIPSGIYYITGFWVDMVGLSLKSSRDLNDIVIQYVELSNFKTI
jgi:hypothetical protein